MKRENIFKNILVYLVLFLGVVGLSFAFDKIFLKLYSIKSIIIETIFVFCGLIIIWKLNLKNKKINIVKSIIITLGLVILWYGLEVVMGFIILKVLKLGALNSVLTILINFIMWVIIFLLICKNVLGLKNVWRKLKKHNILVLIICIIISLLSLVPVFQIEFELNNSQTGIDGLMNIMSVINIFDLTNVIILGQSMIMAILGVGIAKNYEVVG